MQASRASINATPDPVVMAQTDPTNSLDAIRAALHDLRPLKMAEVCVITSTSESQIKRLMASGQFPQPIRRGRWTRWRARDVASFLEAL